MLSPNRSAIFSQLQSDIVRLQRLGLHNNIGLDAGLDFMSEAFPNGSFPLGAVHEFLSGQAEDAAATSGFVSGLISSLMKTKGTGMWISSSRKVFPPALKMLGISPERFVFLDLKNEKDVLWATNEALKCGALTAVVSELKNIDFTQSRRLQLAVEQSQSTCFLLRQQVSNPATTACVSRWKVSSLPSSVPDGLPGIGYPGWKIELLRMRNGKPGSWNVQWMNSAFVSVDNKPVIRELEQKMAG